MKNLIIILVVTFSVLSCKNETKKTEIKEHENHSMPSAKKDASKKKVLSPHTSAMAMIGDAHIHIDYSSPGVRGRIIFGGLVGYDNVWQTGAHMASWIETNKDLQIDGKILPAGKYGFFTIPSKEDWTIIFNRNWDQHGKDDYDSKDDVIRFKVIPEVSDEITEHLVYKVKRKGEKNGEILMSWEKVTIQFPFNVEL